MVTNSTLVAVLLLLLKSVIGEEVHPQCTNRYELRTVNQFKPPQDCESVYQQFPTCKKEIRVSYSDSPPYAQKDKNNNIHGLVTDMLVIAIEMCCMNCTKLKFNGPVEYGEKLSQKNTDIILPIQSGTATKHYLHFQFIPILDIRKLLFLAKEDSDKGAKLSKHMFLSILNTWPLFISALLMALVAGCVVWVLDMFFNRSEFPTAFPKGPFEGFWWAFVSMTTVGYGDRAPKSIIARLFAIVWIMLGITIFSMYTATLTSALSSNIVEMKETSIKGQMIGVLMMSAIGKTAVKVKNGRYKEYAEIEDMIKALKTDEVDAVVLDEDIAKYYRKAFEEEIPKIRIHHTSEIKGTSYGIGVANNTALASFLRSFFETNLDNQLSMLTDVIQTYWPDYHKLEDNVIDSTSYFSSDSPIFIGTVITLIVIGVFTIILGFVCKWIVKRHNHVIPDVIKSKFELSTKKNEEYAMQPMIGKNQHLDKLETCIKDLDEMRKKLVKLADQSNH